MPKAVLLQSRRVVVREDAFIEILIWQVPQPIRGSTHNYKYALALVVRDLCVLRYDNEAGKGDHIHVDDAEHSYRFTDIGQLQRDFLVDAGAWLERHPED